MCELAVATNRLPSEWAEEDLTDVATVLAIIEEQNEKARQS